MFCYLFLVFLFDIYVVEFGYFVVAFSSCHNSVHPILLVSRMMVDNLFVLTAICEYQIACFQVISNCILVVFCAFCNFSIIIVCFVYCVFFNIYIYIYIYIFVVLVSPAFPCMVFVFFNTVMVVVAFQPFLVFCTVYCIRMGGVAGKGLETLGYFGKHKVGLSNCHG